MGNTSSSGATNSVAPPPSAMHHPLIVQGLPGAGVRTLTAKMSLSPKRIMSIDERFLTEPPVYDTAWGALNRPSRASAAAGSNVDSSAWTHGGRSGFHAVWSIIARSTKAIVFVVDSTNRALLVPSADHPALPLSIVEDYTSKSEAEQAALLTMLKARMTVRETLHRILAEDTVRRLPLLVLANKQDAPGAVPPAELAHLLGLPEVQDRDWRLSGCSTHSGEGLQDAFDWLNYIIANPTDYTEQRKARSAAAWAKREERTDRFVQAELRMEKWMHDRAESITKKEPSPPLKREDGTGGEVSEVQRSEFAVAEANCTTEADVTEVARKRALYKQGCKLYQDRLGKRVIFPDRVDAFLGPEPAAEGKKVVSSPVASTAPTAAAQSQPAMAASAAPLPVIAAVPTATEAFTTPSRSESVPSEMSSSHTPSDPVDLSRASTVSPVDSSASDENAPARADSPISPLTPASNEQSAVLLKDGLVESTSPPLSVAVHVCPPFASVSSTCLVLPASIPGPPLPMEWRKEHFWSRDLQMLPPLNVAAALQKDAALDIHKRARMLMLHGMV